MYEVFYFLFNIQFELPKQMVKKWPIISWKYWTWKSMDF